MLRGYSPPSPPTNEGPDSRHNYHRGCLWECFTVLIQCISMLCNSYVLYFLLKSGNWQQNVIEKQFPP